LTANQPSAQPAAGGTAQLDQLQAQIEAAAAAVRQTRPLAGSITNNVTIDFVANAQLAAGGTAAMVYLPDEGETLADISAAIYINMGTQIEALAASIPATAARCCATGTPWVLDPVGIGIGAQRTQILQELKPFKPAIVRGNASEIIALAQLWGLEIPTDQPQTDGPLGVDTTDEVLTALPHARALAAHTGGAVAISGPRDLVVDAAHAIESAGGSAYMPQVTGFGCSLGGVCAVYAACTTPLVAALAATNHFNAAGTAAAAAPQTAGPGSFKVAFLDALANTTPAQIAANPMSAI
jgi:hydroxyethylthiazole kinase